MDIFPKTITSFFDELLTDIECQQDTRSYIVGIYCKYKTAEFDLSKDSITLLYAQAHNKQDFLTYQNLGDWLFYTKSMFPDSLKNASQNYYDNIARLSYYSCYRMIKEWKIYEELSDDYIRLTAKIRCIFLQNNLINIGHNNIAQIFF
jgi:hypothetical protein